MTKHPTTHTRQSLEELGYTDSDFQVLRLVRNQQEIQRILTSQGIGFKTASKQRATIDAVIRNPAIIETADADACKDVLTQQISFVSSTFFERTSNILLDSSNDIERTLENLDPQSFIALHCATNAVELALKPLDNKKNAQLGKVARAITIASASIMSGAGVFIALNTEKTIRQNKIINREAKRGDIIEAAEIWNETVAYIANDGDRT